MYVVYLDFANAIDKVDHKIRLEIIFKVDTRGRLYQWIERFLTNKKQTGCIERTCSHLFDVKRGVPQGMVMGPLLFIIFISDRDSQLNFSAASSFADDARFVKEVTYQIDCQNLQNDLDKIFSLALGNSGAFNFSTFELIRYSTRRTQTT